MRTAYIEKNSSRLNILEAARQAGISSQRFRRILQRLQIPVERSGWMVLVDRTAITQVKRAVRNRVIRPGRPKKKALRGERSALKGQVPK